ncbi:hypothetical protein ACQPXH_20780 [Nocardia sp. CA-135953]|uniref:hypothetical protein n=1 Tax=Nocardia sp. CA-135953 TaxID=3239978 RepID=UPI003D99D7F8
MSEASQHLYLDRSQLCALADLLRAIPELDEDLTIARSRQARIGARRDYGIPRHPSEQPLPYDQAAADAADGMRAVLVSWVRLVCEQRAIDYPGSTTTAGIARWLARNLIALAMTVGSEAAPTEIDRVVQAALRVISPPEESAVLDDAALLLARSQRLNASGLAALAKRLGAEYRTLTLRRVQTLRDAGKISPIPGPWSPEWPELFAVGQVLDAHLAYPSRRRRAASATTPPRHRVSR